MNFGLLEIYYACMEMQRHKEKLANEAMDAKARRDKALAQYELENLKREGKGVH